MIFIIYIFLINRVHFLRVINNRTYNLLYKNYIYNRKKFILSMIYFLICVCGKITMYKTDIIIFVLSPRMRSRF